jgi:hypothetical protein
MNSLELLLKWVLVRKYEIKWEEKSCKMAMASMTWKRN